MCVYIYVYEYIYLFMCEYIYLCIDLFTGRSFQDDIRILRDIEQYYSTQIDEMPMNLADLV